MKIRIAAKERDLFQKTCIEARCTCKFHEIEGNTEMLNVYVRDNDLGELSAAIAFYLGIAFKCNLGIEEIQQDREKLKESESTGSTIGWIGDGTYKFGGQDKFKRDEN